MSSFAQLRDGFVPEAYASFSSMHGRLASFPRFLTLRSFLWVRLLKLVCGGRVVALPWRSFGFVPAASFRKNRNSTLEKQWVPFRTFPIGLATRWFCFKHLPCRKILFGIVPHFLLDWRMASFRKFLIAKGSKVSAQRILGLLRCADGPPAYLPCNGV